MRGFILTPTYRVRGGVPEVRLYGVLENGRPFLVIDDRPRPYFFVRAADRDRLDTLTPGLHVEATDLRTFAGEPVARVIVAVPGDVPPLRTRLEAAGVECLEADVRFASRYLIDRGIRGALHIDGPSRTHDRLGLVFHNPEVGPCHWTPTLKVLSIDIETDPTADHVLSIALHAPNLSRVLIVHEHAFPHAEPVHSERVLLQRFLAYLDELDPDVITGWNVAEFDLAVLARRARHYTLPFPIGRSDDPFELRRELGYTRSARAITHGRLVLDGLSLLHGAFIRLPDYRLETAAQTLLGRGKLIGGHHRADAILRAYQDDPERFVAYNLEDARLVSDILAQTGLVELAVERSLLTGMPLDRVSAAIASVDALYLGALRGRGRVAPSVGADLGEVRLTGGYVMDSVPGLYRNVLVFDFKSLYPSIIRTFNLDPLALLPADDTSDAIVAPNGAHFRRDERGILPELVEALGTARERAKRHGQAVKSHAIKILMNSMYGVLGAGACRLFSPAVSNAITHFGQFLIRTAAELAEREGYRVIYGDTDSLFVHAGDEVAPDDALARAESLRRAIGDAIAQLVRDRFRCESHLDLEFEKLYLRFFLPEVRSGRTGSKKRYAGLLRDADGHQHIEFVGLESVRRDWSQVSKRFQLGLLERVFADQPVDEFVRSFVAELRAGRHDDALAYRKAIRKDLDAYTKTTPPHVRAARLLGETAGRIIAYTMTHKGAEPAGEETAAPDYNHYVEHQLKPVGDAILRFLHTDFDTLTGAQRQLSLF